MDKYKGHTPGPWRDYEPSKRVKELMKGIISPGDIMVSADNGVETHGFIAIVNNSPDEGTNNARLIIDAPMLAEQNAKMLDMLREHDSVNEYIGCGDLEDRTRKLITEIEEGNNA